MLIPEKPHELEKPATFTPSETDSYKSGSSSSNCTAVFTSDTEATYQCTDIPVSIGAGDKVTITNGSFPC